MTVTPSLLSPVRAAEESPYLEWGHDVKTLARSSELCGMEGLRALCCCSPVLGPLAGSQALQAKQGGPEPCTGAAGANRDQFWPGFMQLEAAFGSEQADAAGGAAL